MTFDTVLLVTWEVLGTAVASISSAWATLYLTSTDT